MVVFSPLTYGRACFLLAFFREMGRGVLVPVDALAMWGWSVSFPFSSDLIGNLFHCLGGLFCFFFFGGSRGWDWIAKVR